MSIKTFLEQLNSAQTNYRTLLRAKDMELDQWVKCISWEVKTTVHGDRIMLIVAAGEGEETERILFLPPSFANDQKKKALVGRLFNEKNADVFVCVKDLFVNAAGQTFPTLAFDVRTREVDTSSTPAVFKKP